MKPFGYVYDERMLLHKCNYDDTMAERPERMKIIYERLQNEGLLEKATKIEAREATEDELLLNHPIEIIQEMAALDTDEACEGFCRSHEILWMSPESERAARVAAGGCIEMLLAHKQERIGNGFALVRPPGHHSYGKSPMGYCLYNNVAIMAKYAVEKLGYTKVAIVDFDYHCANGTYYSARGDSRILLTSFHSYHRGLFWPFSREFDYATQDHSLFFPLNCAMNTESDYIGAFNHVVMPVLKEWGAELVLVSAGFDSGYYDLMLDLGQAIKAPGYGHIARLLDEAFPDRVLAVLEGGYFPHCYSESALMFTRGLMSLPLPLVEFPSRINGSMAEVVWNNLVHHASRWECLRQWLEKLQERQRTLSLEEYKSDNSIYLGHEVKQTWNKIMSSGAGRTREWFPMLGEEQQQLCIQKIDEVKKSYRYSNDIEKLSEEQLLQQLVWDTKSKSECSTKAAPSIAFWTEDFLAFKEKRKNHMMVCDWQLVHKNNVELNF